MPKMGEEPAVSQKEYNKTDYDAKAEELSKLGEEEAQEQDDEKKMEILGKKIALKKELKGLMGVAEEEAGKENVERDHEVANEENERLNAEKEAKAKEAEAQHKIAEAERAKDIEAEAKKTAQMLEEVRAKINSIDTGVLGGERKGEVKAEVVEEVGEVKVEGAVEKPDPFKEKALDELKKIEKNRTTFIEKVRSGGVSTEDLSKSIHLSDAYKEGLVSDEQMVEIFKGSKDRFSNLLNSLDKDSVLKLDNNPEVSKLIRNELRGSFKEAKGLRTVNNHDTILRNLMNFDRLGISENATELVKVGISNYDDYPKAKAAAIKAFQEELLEDPQVAFGRLSGDSTASLIESGFVSKKDLLTVYQAKKERAIKDGGFGSDLMRSIDTFKKRGILSQEEVEQLVSSK